MKTTLNKIRAQNPCKDGWETLLKYLGKTKSDDETLTFVTILDAVGLQRALWCFRAVEGCEKEKLLLAVTYAREVEHLMPADSKKALDVFERYANGLATQDEFDVAHKAAARAAATWDAARRAAAAAAAVYYADDAAAYAVAAGAAARSTLRAKQEIQLRQLLERTCTKQPMNELKRI